MLERLTAPVKARPDASHRRVLAIASALTLWMIIIGGRLGHLQMSQHEWLRERARLQQESVMPAGAPRGLIVDRAGRELARSIEVESFFAVPGEIADAERTAARLAEVLPIDAAALAEKLRRAQAEGRKFVWVARKLTADQAAAVGSLKLAGVRSLKETKRFYPNGPLAAHVLGFVGLDESGLGGVEQAYDDSLSGETGRLSFETDGRRRPYDSFGIGPRPGQTLVLTIDQAAQHWTEQALAAAVERARARSGTAIVLDPHTGEILALANAPAFDPNQARRFGPEARVNQALQNIYEPGSTFKIVAYAATLEKGLGKPTDRIDCQMGSINVYGRTVRDHSPFGTLTLTEALAKSSNVAAIKLGMRLGDDVMYDYITRFGFGARTGIELPGETAGLVRPVARWQRSSIGSIAIGQEIGVTPLQMVSAFGALANDGVRVAPHIVREMRAADGTVLVRAHPQERRVLGAETAAQLREMLESVTLKGTARRAQLDGYTAAGKTGTAQKIDPRTRAYSKTKHVASFVGFAPVSNPAVVIIVVIDEPVGAYHGGDTAAPVFREIAERILPLLNVAPDIELKSSPGALLVARDAPANGPDESSEKPEASGPDMPRVVPDGAGGGEIVYAVASGRALAMPDLRGRSVRDAARICAQLGLQLEARGEGRAVRQQPAAGANIESGQVVRIDFSPSG
jgi:cell division protein FtsI (penicillin-binding protein 3)